MEQNKTAKYFVKKLREYAKKSGLMVRSTSDLSPLEEWLLMELYKKELEGTTKI